MNALFTQAVLFVGAFALSGCSGAPGELDESLGKTQQAIVNGLDNRVPAASHPDPSLRRLAAASTAMLISAQKVNASNPANITFTGGTLQSVRNLCTNQNQQFLTDPTPGDCSATLIDDDLVLTAGHCVNTQTCANTRFVFNYFRNAAGVLNTIQSADVFSCARVASQSVSGQDFAIIQLDRPATPRFVPAPVRISRSPLAQGQSLAALGFPDGTPIKVSSGAIVATQSALPPVTLTVSADTFVGSSGSALYDMTRYQVAGVSTDLTNQGSLDYVAGPAGSTPVGCKVAQVCGELGCGQNAPPATYVGPALDAYCAPNSNPRLCRQRNQLVYSASNTNSGSQNTFSQFVFLDSTSTIDFGTCVTPGGSATGDTFVELVAADGTVVVSNDDGGGSCGVASHATYTAADLTAGLFEIRGGCFSSGACSGTIAYDIQGAYGGTFSYAGANTSSATQATRDETISLLAGQTLTAGTCGVEGASFRGDTFLRLFSGTTELTNSNDACGGVGSQLTFTASSNMIVTLKSGCFAGTSCDATVAYTRGVSSIPFSASNTNGAIQNTVNQTVHLGARDQLTVGTCGLPGASFSGDTEVRVFLGATSVAVNDDACSGVGSGLTVRAAAAGDYSVHVGCFSGGSCSGTAVVKVMRNPVSIASIGFSVTGTANATVNTRNVPLFLQEGENIIIGTCPGLQSGGSGTGDTFLRVFGPNGLEFASNDDNCASSPLLSSVPVLVPFGGAGAYEVHAGCFGASACSGFVGAQTQ